MVGRLGISQHPQLRPVALVQLVQEDVNVGFYGSVFAATLVGLLSYVVDRGIAFHVCLYSAIASGGKFAAEDAYREMNDPFVRPSKIILVAALILSSYVLAHRGGIHGALQVAFVFIIALCYVSASIATALKAFRRTQYSRESR